MKKGLPLELLSGVDNLPNSIVSLLQGFFKAYIKAINMAGRKKALYQFLQEVVQNISINEHPYYKEVAQYLLNNWSDLQVALIEAGFEEQALIRKGEIPSEKALFGQLWMILYRVEGMSDKQVDMFAIRTLSAWGLLPQAEQLSGMFDWLVGSKTDDNGNEYEDGKRYGGIFGRGDYYEQNGQTWMGDLFTGDYYDTYGTTRTGNLLDAINPFSDGVTSDGRERLNPFATANWDKMSSEQKSISLNNRYSLTPFELDESEFDTIELDETMDFYAFDDNGNITGTYSYNGETGEQGAVTPWGDIVGGVVGAGSGILQTVLNAKGEQDKVNLTRDIYNSVANERQNGGTSPNNPNGGEVYDTLLDWTGKVIGADKNSAPQTGNNAPMVISQLPQGATRLSDGSVRLSDGTVIPPQQAQQQYGYYPTTKSSSNNLLLYGGIGLAVLGGFILLNKNGNKSKTRQSDETGLGGIPKKRQKRSPKKTKRAKSIGFVELQ